FLACGLVLANGARHNLAPHAAAIEAQILKAADHVDPTVRYDEEWFESHCDLSEFSQDMLFLGPEFRLSKRPTVDAHRWHPGYKCTEDGAGRAPEFVEISEEFQCAERCWETARKVPGTVVCCEHHQDKSRCEVRVGWQSMQESDYGKNKLNPANWALFGRHQKKARLFFSPPSTHENHRYVPQFESEEVRQAESGKQHVRELARQVNHLSIEMGSWTTCCPSTCACASCQTRISWIWPSTSWKGWRWTKTRRWQATMCHGRRSTKSLRTRTSSL
ncbi:unnamed protein product, partial [Effrenium voratum]